jgi:hypothetical protein
MRYLIAMCCAVAAAAAATFFLSTPTASWVVRQFTFDSPDSVATLHALVFMLTNLIALVAGFTLGWALGVRFKDA